MWFARSCFSSYLDLQFLCELIIVATPRSVKQSFTAHMHPSLTSDIEVSTKHRLPAIDRAVRVLDILVDGPTSLADISARLHVPRSTIYRIINSLQAAHLVVREQDGSYVLGPALLRLARATPVRTDVVSLSRRPMEALAALSGETVKLSRLDGDDAVVVDVVLGHGNFSVTTLIGRRFPVHIGAASKVLIAHLPQPAIDAVIARQHFPGHAKRSRLLKELSVVRESGYALDDGTFSNGIQAVAAPIRDATANVVASISIPFLPSANRDVPDLINKVVSAARTISFELGG